MSAIETETTTPNSIGELSVYDRERKERARAHFQALVDQEQLEAEYGIGKVSKLRVPSAGGYSRATALLETAAGHTFIVHLYPPWADEEDVSAESRLLDYLRTRDIPVPETLRTSTGSYFFFCPDKNQQVNESPTDQKVRKSDDHQEEKDNEEKEKEKEKDQEEKDEKEQTIKSYDSAVLHNFRFGIVRTYLPGEHYDSEEHHQDPKTAAGAGDMLGRFHAASSALSPEAFATLLYPNDQVELSEISATQPAVLVEQLHRHADHCHLHIDGALLGSSGRTVAFVAQGLHQVADAVAAQLGHLALDVDRLPHGIVHTDWHDLNLLFSCQPAPAGPPLVSAVLDLEDACWGPFLLDVGFAAIEWARLQPALLKPLFDSYQTSFGRPLTALEVEALPRYVLYALAQAAAWCAEPRALPTTEAFNYLIKLLDFFPQIPVVSSFPFSS